MEDYAKKVLKMRRVRHPEVGLIFKKLVGDISKGRERRRRADDRGECCRGASAKPKLFCGGSLYP